MNDSNKTLVIGVGNPLRRDDGVGVYIVNRLKATMEAAEAGHLYCFMQSNGEGSRLMDAWSGYDTVVVFDALMKQGHPGLVVELNPSTQAFPSDYFRYSSHAFSVAEAVEMARVLGDLPRSLQVYGIEGEDFGFGEGLSEHVKASAEKIIAGFAK